MRTTLVIACSLLACERDPDRTVAPPPPKIVTLKSEPVTPPPQPKLIPPHIAVPPPAISVPRPEPARPPHKDGPLPVPPTVEPKAYAAWLASLSQAQQKQVAKFCHGHKLDFQTTCGGIGPLHIPYPPYPRAAMPGPDSLRSLFASTEEWHNSLTAPQRSYLQRECPGGEDQPTSDLCGDNTPLVVALADQPVVFAAGAPFDAPTAATPWLALDRDGDGTISAAELFGSSTVLPDGTTAVNGFAALRALDANGDGAIDARDPAFAALVLWSGGELARAADTIVSISLANHVAARCDARGNCEGERAALIWRDAAGALHRGSIVDVYLPRR